MAFGALPQDTAEFMLGSVVVTPVFFESNGKIDASTENWNPQHIQETLGKITQATDWWVQTLANLNTVHQLSFTIDTTFASNPFETAYEPINRRSNDYDKYVSEFLKSQGYNSADIATEMLRFNNAQRVKFGTDWAFTMIVVNSQNQGDGQFAPGGTFNRAFAFAGGLFMVVPSTRPASTFAHESGHIFWARDEYAGAGVSGRYHERRGYYNSRNENAVDMNPNPNFIQQPSIMAAETVLDTAWAQRISAPATLAQIGWRDSDGDGIFDVLDVPLELTGTGFFDLGTGKYRFQGNAKVQTLPNLNSEGYRSDITINKIGEIEYRFGNGPWQRYSQPGTYEAALDLEITIPNGATEIQIRARDPLSTVTSNVFRGRLSRADATEGAGINGFLWLDSNKNGLRDVGEYGQAGWTVSLVDNSGQPLQLSRQIEPNTMADGPVGSNAINGVILGSVGDGTDGRAGVIVDPALPGNKIFAPFSISTQSFVPTWTSSGRRFQATFVAETTTVSIDAIGTSSASYGRLEAYNSSGQLVGRYTTKALGVGQTETMTVSRGVGDISYVIASATALTTVKLDNLRYGARSSIQSDALGRYYFPALPAGTYQVKATPAAGWSASAPGSGQLQATVLPNTSTRDIDFGFVQSGSLWQNPRDQLDVNDSELITPTDALLIINLLNDGRGGVLAGSGIPLFPYIDVSGDGNLTPTDALLVINYLNSRPVGSGESPGNKLFSQASAVTHLEDGVCFPANPSTPLVGEGEDERDKEGDELLILLSLDRLRNFAVAD